MLLFIHLMLTAFSKFGFTASRCKRRVKSSNRYWSHSFRCILFQERVGKPFIRLIKDNISSWFRSSSKDVLSAFSIFDPKKVPSLSTHELPLYGDSSIQNLIGQFGWDLPVNSLERTEFEKAAIVSSDFSGYPIVSSKQPKERSWRNYSPMTCL